MDPSVYLTQTELLPCREVYRLPRENSLGMSEIFEPVDNRLRFVLIPDIWELFGPHTFNVPEQSHACPFMFRAAP